jgi:uncharacterized protein (DUF433 family)
MVESTPTPDRIVIDPAVCHGKPVVRGTRTPVTVILDAIAAGDDFTRICDDYSITLDDVRACVAFASREVSHQSYVSLSA